MGTCEKILSTRLANECSVFKNKHPLISKAKFLLLMSFLHGYLLTDSFKKIMSSDIFLYLAYLMKTCFVPLPTK